MIEFHYTICVISLASTINSHFGSASLTLLSRDVSEFDGKILSAFSRTTLNGTILGYCQYQCLLDEECMSFFYNRITGVCQIHAVVFFNPDEGELCPGNRYYLPYQDFCPSDLGYIYNRALHFCYKFHFMIWGPFSYGRQICQDEGGDLVIIDTKAKLHHIVQTVKGTTFPILSRFLVGATDETIEGDWRWLDGQQVDPDFWMPGQPDASVALDDYGIIDNLGDFPGSMRDIDGWSPFICEIKI